MVSQEIALWIMPMTVCFSVAVRYGFPYAALGLLALGNIGASQARAGLADQVFFEARESMHRVDCGGCLIPRDCIERP